MAAGGAEQVATNFPQAALQLPAIERGVFAHNSSRQDEFVAKRGRDGSPRFHQCLQMRLGCELEAQHGFATIPPVSVATR